MIHIARYFPQNTLLRKMVKYFWVLQSEVPVDIAHILLPVGNPDLIINLSEPIWYVKSKQKTAISTPIHLNGIRDQSCLIRQTGKLEVMGVAFFHTDCIHWSKFHWRS